MAVVEVVDDADVLLFAGLHHRDHVLRFPGPASVVVDADLTPLRRDPFRERGQERRRRFHFVVLAQLRVGLWQHHPEFGFDLVLLQQVEDELSVLADVGGEPDALQGDLVVFQQFEFFVERRQMLGAPVVGVAREAESLEHGHALFGAALLAVERDDAPRRKVLGCERLRFRSDGECRGEQKSKQENRSHRRTLGTGARIFRDQRPNRNRPHFGSGFARQHGAASGSQIEGGSQPQASGGCRRR